MSLFFAVSLGSQVEQLEGNGPVEPAASRAIEDEHAVHVQSRQINITCNEM